VPVADMAAQLAAMGCLSLVGAAPAAAAAPEPAAAAAAVTLEPGLQLVDEVGGAGSGCNCSLPDGARQDECGTASGAPPTDSAAACVPSAATAHLHLLPAVSSWQPPGTVFEQLRLVCGFYAAAPDSPPAPIQTSAEQVAAMFGEARLALFWVSARWRIGPAGLSLRCHCCISLISSWRLTDGWPVCTPAAADEPDGWRDPQGLRQEN
jgi:hypothetical protein